jgi:hypothetical protein
VSSAHLLATGDHWGISQHDAVLLQGLQLTYYPTNNQSFVSVHGSEALGVDVLCESVYLPP